MAKDSKWKGLFEKTHSTQEDAQEHSEWDKGNGKAPSKEFITKNWKFSGASGANNFGLDSKVYTDPETGRSAYLHDEETSEKDFGHGDRIEAKKEDAGMNFTHLAPEGTMPEVKSRADRDSVEDNEKEMQSLRKKAWSDVLFEKQKERDDSEREQIELNKESMNNP